MLVYPSRNSWESQKLFFSGEETRGGWKCYFFQLYFAKQALALKLSMLAHRKIPPNPRAFESHPLRGHPHKLPFVILVFYLLFLALGCNFLLMVFRVAKGFLLSLLLWFRICWETWTFHTQDDVNNCGRCFTSLFLQKTVTAINMMWQLKCWELPSWKRAL